MGVPVRRAIPKKNAAIPMRIPTSFGLVANEVRAGLIIEKTGCVEVEILSTVNVGRVERRSEECYEHAPEKNPYIIAKTMTPAEVGVRNITVMRHAATTVGRSMTCGTM